jgi:hypothetical protein
MGRIFFGWLILAVAIGVGASAEATTTLVTGVLPRADGTPAQGTLLISWPDFTTAGGDTVAAGSKTVSLGSDGSVQIALFPNTGSTPQGTYYKVLKDLDDGTRSTEYWVVPQVTQTTIAAVRSLLVPQTQAMQFVGRDYVDTSIAGVVGSSVELTGDQTIAGVKTFQSSPQVPTPTNPGDAANRQFVLQTLSSSGGAQGQSASGTVNATVFEINGVALSSANLSDGATLAKISQIPSFPGVASDGNQGLSVAGGVAIGKALSAANLASIGPRYDVTQYGAAGNGSTDDTAAIQAAFNACFNNVVLGATGGIVEFPGPHSYLISSTINAYDGCQIEGTIGSTKGGYQQPIIWWNGPTSGTVSTITAFSMGAGLTPTLSSPYIAGQTNRQMPYYATFTAANTLTAGQWVDIEGLSTTNGLVLNRTIAQVSATGLSSTQFTVGIPYAVSTVGTTADSGTATTVNVAVAFDAAARYQQNVQNLVVGQVTATQTNRLDVGFYYGSRVDTGTRVWNVDVSGATKYGYYFANGGINVDFDKGWRTDGAGIAGIYWRVNSSDSFGIANGTTDNSRSAYGSSTSGAAVMLDNAGCVANAQVHFTARNVKHEINTNQASGLGTYTLYDCPANANGEQFFLDFENVWQAPAGGLTSYSGLVVSPTNDAALVMNISNGQFAGGSAASRWAGVPALVRNDIGGTNGYISLLSYAPAFKSNSGFESSAYGNNAAPVQLAGDVNFGQLYQYGIHASALLFSDTAFAALPNATTLYAGQVIAPPAVWNGSTTPSLYVVTATGTTGTPNGGTTACVSTTTTYQLSCNSSTDLSAGQKITVGSVNTTIKYVDATNPSAVLVWTMNGVGTISTPTALTFTAPLLSTQYSLGGSGGSAAISELTGGTNTTAAMVIGSGASLTATGTGSIVATSVPWSGLTGSPSTMQAPFQSLTTTGSSGAATLSGGVLNIPQYSAGASAFGTLTGGTNTTAAMVIGSGASLTATGTGSLVATGVSASLNDTTTGTVLSVQQNGVGTSSPLASFYADNSSASDYPLYLGNQNTSGHVLKAYSGSTELFDVSGGSGITIQGQTQVQSATAAISGTNQNSPWTWFNGNAYGTSGSTYSGFGFRNVLSNTANTPTNTLTLGTQQGSGLTGTFNVDFSAAANFKAATVNATNGYQVNGSALAFSNIAGTPSTTQVPFQSLTTTGTSGTATLSGGVLNIPQYSGGTVTSVTFTGDGTVLSSTPSTAVTSSGTLTAALANAAQNSVFAGPASGGAGAPSYQTAPTFSAANLTNFPTLNQNTTGTAAGITGLVKYGSEAGFATAADPGTTANVPMVSDGSHGVQPSAGGALGTGAYAAAYSLPAATTSTLGGVRTDGSTISNSGGLISCTTATTSQPGCVRPDGSTITISGGVLSSTGGGGGAFPQTVSGTVNSGGIPYFSSATQESSSAALTANALVKGGGAGVAPSSSSVSDNGTTVSTPELVNLSAAGALSTLPVTISGTPVTSGGTGTTTYPLFSIWTSGATAPTTWNTGGTLFGINEPSGFAGSVFDVHNNGGVSVFSIASNGTVVSASEFQSSSSTNPGFLATAGAIEGKAFGGYANATIAAGAAAGSSPTIACATSHVCSFPNGTISLTTGSSTTTGALLTIGTSLTHTNLPDCQASIVLAASPYTATSNYLFSYSPTSPQATLNVGTALTASTAYTVTYWCPGY